MVIKAASTISHQHTFRNPGFSRTVKPIDAQTLLQSPEYSSMIPVMDRRRMSDVLKMGIACTTDCLEQSGIGQPDAIIVGTGMGCSIHTKSFLDKMNSGEGGLISPTSFILSLHNTIAGQISIHQKNHCYNMTHTQNSLSFEYALIDSLMCLGEGAKNVLVGGTDEQTDSIYNIRGRLEREEAITASGASFFIVSEDEEDMLANVIDLKAICLMKKGVADEVLTMLTENHMKPEEIDLVLHVTGDEDEMRSLFANSERVDYLEFSGTWMSSSAWAVAYAVDRLQTSGENKPLNNVLICNRLIKNNLGLILLSKS